MKTITISLTWAKIIYDLEANTWKAGLLTQREDGQQSELQVSKDESLDVNVAKRNTMDSISRLAEVLKRWNPTITQSSTTWTSDPTSIVDATTWSIALSVTNRSDATDAQVSLLAHSYIVSHIVSEWWKLTNPAAAKTWEDREAWAQTQLISAMHYKTAPTLA